VIKTGLNRFANEESRGRQVEECLFGARDGEIVVFYGRADCCGVVRAMFG
jgi:hypothetical protein